MTGGSLSSASKGRARFLFRHLLSPWSATLLALFVCGWVLWLHVLQHRALLNEIEGIEGVRQARLELLERFDALRARRSPAALSALEVARLRLQGAVEALRRERDSSGEVVEMASGPFLAALDEFQKHLAEWSRTPGPAVAENATLYDAFQHVQAHADLFDRDLYSALRLHIGATDAELGETLIVAVILLLGVSLSVFFSQKARRIANAEALEADRRLRQAVEAARVGLWDWDLRSGKVHFSPEWKRQIGYEDDEISDDFSEWESRVHPDDLERARAQAQSFIANPWPDYRNEFRFRHRDGSYRWLVAQASLIYDDQGKPVRMMGSHLDLTEQRRMEEAIREERDKFSAIASVSPGVLHSWRLRPDGTSCFPYMAPGIRHLYGIAPEDMLESDELLQTILHPDDREALWNSVRDACNSMEPWCYQYRVIHPERGEVWIEGRSAPVREADGSITWHGVLTDITERKNAEDLLRASEERLRLVQESLLDGLVVFRAVREDGRIVDFEYEYTNPASARLLGRRHACGERLLANYPALREYPLWELFIHTVETGEPLDLDMPYSGEGREFWFRHSCSRLGDGLIVLFQDIGARKAAEDALKESLQEKTVLLKEVHHRVKNNLQIVSSLLRLQASRSSDEQVRQAMEEMGARIGSIALLHEVLYRSENLARVNFATYVGELCRQLQRSFGTSRVSLREINRVGDLKLSLEQCVPCGLILNELVSNAFKHGFGEGASGNVWVELEREGSRLRLRVRDDGTGLAPEFSLSSPRTLGLQLVLNLVGQLGGELAAERPNGAGAVFTVTFEAADSAEGA